MIAQWMAIIPEREALFARILILLLRDNYR
jgi:hypothetical protein